MSYTFLQEQGEESSVECFSDIPQSVLLRLNLIADEFYSNGNETESCQSSQSGMMFAHSTGNLGEEKSKSFAEDSLAKTYQSETKTLKALMGIEADYGRSLPGSLAKYDRHTASWKTAQLSLLEGWDEFWEIWPKWGMMRNGECWERIPLVVFITEPDFGWLPTPVATDWKGGCSAIRKDTGKIRMDLMRHYIKNTSKHTYPNPNFLEAVMVFPTGWTELKPLEMHKWREWLEIHS
jgi:hypothetical protein